jgi:hypothetical protein
MFLFIILMILNSTVTNDLLFDYRLDVGGFPLSILDGLVALAFLKQVLTPGRNTFRTDRTHPLLYWSLGLLVTAILVGMVGAAMGGAPVRQYVTVLRNLSMLPASIFIGYSLVTTPRSARTITYVWVMCSVLSALALLFVVGETTEVLKSTTSSFDELRRIRYGGDTGLAAAGILAVAAISRLRLFPGWVSIALLLICTLGIFSPPHRSAYVAGVMMFLFATLVMPRAPWGRRLGMVAIGTVFLGAALLGGAVVMTQVTGRDFQEYVVNKRLKTLNPFYNDETKTTVTATRLPGILAELQLWSESPLIGKGFAVSVRTQAEAGADLGMNHNVWTAALAQSGPVGLAAFLVPIFGTIVIGRRMWREQTDRDLALLGALATIVGFVAFVWGSLSLSINQQRAAILIGLMFGIAFRCRAMQLTLARQQAEARYLDTAGGYEPMAYDREDTVPVA